MIIKPNPGPQEAFLATPADIAIYGGGAGGGKTWGLLLDPARWMMTVKAFQGVIFRRTYPQIMNPGALWDEAAGLYPLLQIEPVRSETRWVNRKTDSWLKMSHLQREDDVYAWQGAQLAFLAFDELTHFSANQFFYMLSRLRSRCGVRPYVRATCNPDPTSWVADFIKWWIDENTGLPIPERAGVIRYMARRGGHLVWADAPEELTNQGLSPRSVTFIPALLKDNPVLVADNPDYAANLQSLTTVERARLADGNWIVRAVAGSFFKRQWFKVFHSAPPSDLVKVVRCWDRAATEVSENNTDPDWTAGFKMGLRANGTPVLMDCVRLRGTPGQVRATIKATAEADGQEVEVVLPQDPGQAGVVDIKELVKLLAGFPVSTFHERGAKADRAKPLSAQCEHGNVEVVRGPWLEAFFSEAEAFLDERETKAPAGYHDDQIDGASGAYNFLHGRSSPSVRSL